MHRPRVTAIGDKRSRSRGSIAQMHNTTTQQTMDPASYGGNPAMYHFTNNSNDSMDAMNVAVGHHVAYQQQIQQPQQLQQLQQPQQQGWTDGPDSHMEALSHNLLDVATAKLHGVDGGGNSMAAVVGAPKQTNTRSSANNELEMRQLFQGNRHRSLQDVAHEIQGNDQGPNYERSRQLFGMLWYVGDLVFLGRAWVSQSLTSILGSTSGVVLGEDRFHATESMQHTLGVALKRKSPS